MNKPTQHIILIGFKNTGKSVIGQALALSLKKPFIDLDREIEFEFENQFHKKLSCRQIVESQGECFFRELEKNSLKKIINKPEATVIALGGGAVMHEETQEMIKMHMLIHITAPRGIVFERIRVQGRPAFFSEEENLFDTFNRLWRERDVVYKKLTSFTVSNDGSIVEARDCIIHQLKSENRFYDH